MREREVANVVTKSRHSQDPAPISQLVSSIKWAQKATNLIGYFSGICDNIEDPAREFRNTERVLESFVGRPRINEVRQSQLVDMTQPLERARVQDFTFVAVQADEYMNGVPDLMNVLRHGQLSHQPTAITASAGISKNRPATISRLAWSRQAAGFLIRTSSEDSPSETRITESQ